MRGHREVEMKLRCNGNGILNYDDMNLIIKVIKMNEVCKQKQVVKIMINSNDYKELDDIYENEYCIIYNNLVDLVFNNDNIKYLTAQYQDKKGEFKSINGKKDGKKFQLYIGNMENFNKFNDHPFIVKDGKKYKYDRKMNLQQASYNKIIQQFHGALYKIYTNNKTKEKKYSEKLENYPKKIKKLNDIKIKKDKTKKEDEIKNIEKTIKKLEKEIKNYPKQVYNMYNSLQTAIEVPYKKKPKEPGSIPCRAQEMKGKNRNELLINGRIQGILLGGKLIRLRKGRQLKEFLTKLEQSCDFKGNYIDTIRDSNISRDYKGRWFFNATIEIERSFEKLENPIIIGGDVGLKDHIIFSENSREEGKINKLQGVKGLWGRKVDKEYRDAQKKHSKYITLIHNVAMLEGIYNETDITKIKLLLNDYLRQNFYIKNDQGNNEKVNKLDEDTFNKCMEIINNNVEYKKKLLDIFLNNIKIINEQIYRECKKVIDNEIQIKNPFDNIFERVKKMRFKAKKVIKKKSTYISNRRKDEQHKKANEILNKCDVLVLGNYLSKQQKYNSNFEDKPKPTKQTRGLNFSKMNNAHYQCMSILKNTAFKKGKLLYIVSEKNTTRKCNGCGELTGPTGVSALDVREWDCTLCGTHHNRDENAANNIRDIGEELYSTYTIRELVDNMTKTEKCFEVLELKTSKQEPLG